MILFKKGVYAAEIEILSDEINVNTYTVAPSGFDIYMDSALSTKINHVNDKDIKLVITSRENNSYHCRYQIDGETYSGWIEKSIILSNPGFEKIDGMLRYDAMAYTRPKGLSVGTIPDYTDVDVIGKRGKWFQLLYKYNENYWISWLKKKEYLRCIRIFDGAEKKIMSEGTYTLTSADNSMLLSLGESNTLTFKNKAEGISANDVFFIDFLGDGTYVIKNNTTQLCIGLTPEGEIYNNKILLSAVENNAYNDSQLWILERSEGYYYLKNKYNNKYFCFNKNFLVDNKDNTANQRYRIVMYGGKNLKYWHVFSQYDSAWGANLYGKYNTMAGSACGVLSSVNAVYALNGQFMDPMMVADYAVKSGYRVEGQGTDYHFVKACADKFGGDYGYRFVKYTYSLSEVKKHLINGGTAVANVPNHYIAVADFSNGKYLVLDPYATYIRKTNPFGCWIRGKRFLSGSLKSRMYFLLEATE